MALISVHIESNAGAVAQRFEALRERAPRVVADAIQQAGRDAVRRLKPATPEETGSTARRWSAVPLGSGVIVRNTSPYAGLINGGALAALAARTTRERVSQALPALAARLTGD